MTFSGGGGGGKGSLSGAVQVRRWWVDVCAKGPGSALVLPGFEKRDESKLT